MILPFLKKTILLITKNVFARTTSKTQMLIYGLCIINISFAQDKAVILVEKKLPKRTILYAKNTTDSPQNIFLKVNPTGYRKSSSRPLIKTIPAQMELEMITLIPLKDVTSSYTYTLIVNDKPNTIEVHRSEGPKKEANTADIMKTDFVIFTKNECEKCEKILEGLQEKHIPYREINIDTRTRFYDYFWELLKKDGYKEKEIIAPVLVLGGTLKYPIHDVSAVLLEVEHFFNTSKSN